MLLKILKSYSSNPKYILLLDGLGALVSIFFLGIVLVELESIFGIPTKTLYFLAFFPCLFLMYDWYCYMNINTNFGIILKRIATLNIMYCFLSIEMAIYHKDELTAYGWAYILVEILIILIIAIYESTVARKLKLNP